MDSNTTVSLPHGYRLQGEKNEYVIDRVLGQGAFGITYLARYKAAIQGSMGKGSVWAQVAVKEFFMKDMNVREGSTGYLNEVSQDSLVGRYRRAFMREARNLASLHHPNIVNVFEVIEANNTVYIVMEYINGGSLDDHILKNGKLTEQESLDGIHKICSAVSCMHNNKILHLDIKPKNIMLDEEGELYLIDFGLSKQYSENGEPESSTSIGLGTPGYAPIEQAEHQDGDKTFRATLDIYAIGATLFKMLTGNTPPKASQVSDSVIDGNNIIAEQLKKAGITDSIMTVVTKAMWPSSRGRYQSVEEFDKALNDFRQIGQQPVHTEEAEDESTQIVPEQPAPTSTSVKEDDKTVVISDATQAPKAKAEKKDEVPNTKPSFDFTDKEEKKKTKAPLIFTIIGVIIFIVIAIAEGLNWSLSTTNSSKPAIIRVESIIINPQSISLTEGERYELTAIIEPSNAFDKSITWSSNNSEVVLVDGTGSVRANKTGTATVKAICDGKEASCIVSVGSPRQTSDLMSSGNYYGHEYVDLGLSVLWATCNIGANNPEEYGDYYAWGETNTKSTYTWTNYKYRSGGSDFDDISFSAYNNSTKTGTVDNQTLLNTADDIAYVKWGGKWRMPTKEECQELKDKCTWVWTNINGINGYKITSNINGYSDASIFLPASGMTAGIKSYIGQRGYYWSKSLNRSVGLSQYAIMLQFYPNNYYEYGDYCNVYAEYRCYGGTVRPIYSKESTSGTIQQTSQLIQQTSNNTTPATQRTGYNNGHEWVDLGLSIKWATCNVGASKPEDYGDYYAWGGNQHQIHLYI